MTASSTCFQSQRDIRQPERILRKVWEICPSAIVVTDLNGFIEYVNPAFEQSTGYCADEVIGKTPRILKSGTQGPEIYSDLWKTISSGRTWTGRMQNRRKDGSLYWECSTISPLCDEEGKILHYIAVKENITAELESGETARQARCEVEALRRLIVAKEAHIEQLRRNPDLVPHDLKPDLGQDRIVVGGVEIAWNIPAGQCTFRDLPVALMWVDSTLANLMAGMEAMVGQERFALALQAEGRKSVESDWMLISRYEDFREGFDALANNAAIAGWGDWQLVSMDRARRECLFHVHNNWEGLYQRSLGECWGSGMLAGKLAGICSKLFGTNCWATQSRFVAKGDPHDEFLVAPSQRNLENEIESLLTTDQATQADMAVALQKLRQTESSLNEALVAAEAGNRAKSDFFAVISHELRTPLNAVLGFAELLAYTPLDAEQRSYAETISKSGSHLLTIVKDILDFSSIEKGSIAIHVEPMRVADLVIASEQAVKKSAADKGIALSSVIGDGIPETIIGDKIRIGQILINLLANAVKFTSCGSVILRVAPASEDGRPGLDFSVEDTGIGISPETMEVLFQPFRQGDASINRTFGGTGLGLAISRRLAEAMGGRITVASTPGKGSTFTLHIPAGDVGTPPHPFIAPGIVAFADGGRTASGKDAHASKAAQPAAPHETDEKSGVETHGKGLVLVAEDDPDNRALVGRMLNSLGYRAEFAIHGKEAIEAFTPGKYFAILMDMVMPVMSGLEATENIRRLDSSHRVPIIALTANVMPGDFQRCRDAGMDDFLAKPFKRNDLGDTLARFARP